MTPGEVHEVERLVNGWVSESAPLETRYDAGRSRVVVAWSLDDDQHYEYYYS